MPMTKKKGAIFAIYADSPDHPTPETSSGSRLVHSHPPHHSPTRSTTSTRRKALVSLQPSTTKGFPFNPLLPSKSPSGTLDKPSKPLERRPSVNPKSVHVPRPVPSSTVSNRPSPFSKSASKRQLDNVSPVLPPPPGGSRTRASPAKRGRTTPKATRIGKENHPPSPGAGFTDGSPATRTRSKTASNASAVAVSATPLRAMRLSVRPERNAEGLTGDGRGTLTFKKGRAVAALLADNEGDDTLGVQGVQLELGDDGVTPRKQGSEWKRGTGRVMLGDGPLADVSEAYGATGVEPEGFRTARRD